MCHYFVKCFIKKQNKTKQKNNRPEMLHDITTKKGSVPSCTGHCIKKKAVDSLSTVA